MFQDIIYIYYKKKYCDKTNKRNIKIKRIFPNIKEQSDVIERKSEVLLSKTTFDELLVNLRNFTQGEEIEPIWFDV